MMLADISSLLLTMFNMSITACFIALAVIALRFIFKKAPKYISCLLWGLVALRLVLPFSIESIFSLVPSSETLPQSIITDNSFKISSGINVIDNPINEYLGDHYAEGVTVPTNTGLNVMEILSVIWIIGIIAMLLYAIISVIRVKRSVKLSFPLNDKKGVYMADNIETAFILGIFRPKIYVPSNIDDHDMKLVIAHEKTHLKRFDHYFKPLGFLILSVYWFNPVLWICYILFCKDIEGACDERVLKTLSADIKKDYSKALIKLSTSQKLVVACPLAFGETGVKGRVKNILNYKKPAFWVIAVAVVATIVASVCLLTNPVMDRTIQMESKALSDINPNQIIKEIKRIQRLPEDTELYIGADTTDLLITKDFSLYMPYHITFYYKKNNKCYYSQLQVMHNTENIYYVTESSETDFNGIDLIEMKHYFEAIKYLPNREINKMAPEYDFYHLNLYNYELAKSGDYAITYSGDGEPRVGAKALHLGVSLMKETENKDGYQSQGEFIDLYYNCDYKTFRVFNYRSSLPEKVIKSTDLEEAVHLSLIYDHEKNNVGYEEFVTEGHTIFATDDRFYQTVAVYMFQLTKGHSFVNGKFVSGGFIIPTVAIFEKQLDEYVLKEMRYPIGPVENEESVKAMMPFEYLEKALKGPSDQENAKIYEQTVSQAEQYLKSIGREAEMYNKSSEPLDVVSNYFKIDVDISEKIYLVAQSLGFLGNICKCEIIEDGKRYVYQTDLDLERERIILTKYEFETNKVVKYYEIDVYTAELVSDVTAPEYFIEDQYLLREKDKLINKEKRK